MKSTTAQVLALFSGIALSITVYAHDPSEHAGKGEKPNCSAMQNMDQNQKNMSDPVMQAMMKKCTKGMQDDAMEHGHDAVQEQGNESHEESGEPDASGGHDH